ncbi:MAG: hypothetical protein HY215_09030 [Candidatus Rokubacteria bacterium]|nr:hypothetical protein [Candidatus Rokubacteria bacterium]
MYELAAEALELLPELVQAWHRLLKPLLDSRQPARPDIRRPEVAALMRSPE